ncbi:hypothetical protein SDJN02_23217, partial [Cucurbita argyrosperma subsp. argyrosperma]
MEKFALFTVLILFSAFTAVVLGYDSPAAAPKPTKTAHSPSPAHSPVVSPPTHSASPLTSPTSSPPAKTPAISPSLATPPPVSPPKAPAAAPVSSPAASPVVSGVSPVLSPPSPLPSDASPVTAPVGAPVEPEIPANPITGGTPVETPSIFPSSSSPPMSTPASLAPETAELPGKDASASGKYRIGAEREIEVRLECEIFFTEIERSFRGGFGLGLRKLVMMMEDGDFPGLLILEASQQNFVHLIGERNTNDRFDRVNAVSLSCIVFDEFGWRLDSSIFMPIVVTH